MPGVNDLIGQWRRDAKTCEGWSSRTIAAVLTRCAEQLERALRDADEEALDLRSAAAACGFSEDHLGRLVREGRLVNVGRKHAPRIRRGDLPRRVADRREPGYDPRTDARDLLQK